MKNCSVLVNSILAVGFLLIQSCETEIEKPANENALSQVQTQSSFQYPVTTLAGSTQGYEDADGTNAKFYWPYAIAADQSGLLYVYESGNKVIRTVKLSGKVSTFYNPQNPSFSVREIEANKDGTLYYTDAYTETMIKRICKKGENVELIAGGDAGFKDGPALDAKFINAFGLTQNKSEVLYISDMGNHAIRKLTGEMVSTLAGGTWDGTLRDGTGTEAAFIAPEHLTIDNAGNLYVKDGITVLFIRKITPSGVVTTIAGSGDDTQPGEGTGSNVWLGDEINGITYADDGNLYITVSFYSNGSVKNVIKKVTPSGIVSIIAGGDAGYLDGNGLDAKFGRLGGITAVGDALYVCDYGNNKIRKIRVQ